MGPGSRVKESATYSQLETLKLKTEALGMDYLAHGIWSYNIFHRLRKPVFLPTPFLWPISDWKFPGISWAEPWFMVVNYTLMLGCLIWILARRRRGKRA